MIFVKILFKLPTVKVQEEEEKEQQNSQQISRDKSKKTEHCLNKKTANKSTWYC